MKNKLISSIIISVIFALFILNIIWMIFIDWSNLIFIAPLILLILFSLLIIIYFLRIYLPKCPKFIKYLFKVMFLDFGKFKLNQKVFFMVVFYLTGITLVILNLVFLSSSTAIFNNNMQDLNSLQTLTTAIILGISGLFVVALIALWITDSQSKNFYKDSRYICLLLPLFGWIYYFTYQINHEDLPQKDKKTKTK